MIYRSICVNFKVSTIYSSRDLCLHTDEQTEMAITTELLGLIMRLPRLPLSLTHIFTIPLSPEFPFSILICIVLAVWLIVSQRKHLSTLRMRPVGCVCMRMQVCMCACTCLGAGAGGDNLLYGPRRDHNNEAQRNGCHRTGRVAARVLLLYRHNLQQMAIVQQSNYRRCTSCKLVAEVDHIVGFQGACGICSRWKFIFRVIIKLVESELYKIIQFS